MMASGKAVTNTHKNPGIQVLYVTRNVLQTTKAAEFRVCCQYGDLHVRGDVIEQVAERPRHVLLFVTKQNWLMATLRNSHNWTFTLNISSISVLSHMESASAQSLRDQPGLCHVLVGCPWTRHLI